MDKKLNKRVGQNCRHIRIMRGLSQEALAHDLKIDQSSLSRIESGKRSLSISEMLAIMNICDVSALNILYE